MNEYCTPRHHVCIGEPTCRTKPETEAFEEAESPLTVSEQVEEADPPKRGRPAKTPKE